jgi:type II secretory pathway pseudopilin PulG
MTVATSDRPIGRRPAFTLVEALVAVTIAAVAASALLMGIHSSLQTTDAAMQQTIAAGMAQQVIDEVVGNLYCQPGLTGYQTTLGPSSSEAQGTGRERFNDIDDYHAQRAKPPEDPWGVVLGKDNGKGGQRHVAFQAPTGYFDNWQQEIDVYYVRESDTSVRLPSGQTSDYRAVEVRIVDVQPDGARRELVKLRRVVAYVPVLP